MTSGSRPRTERDSGYIAVHQYHRMDGRAYFSAFESIVAEHGGRPHWGKLHTLDAARLGELYPRFEDFLRLREKLDPGSGLRQRVHDPGLRTLRARPARGAGDSRLAGSRRSGTVANSDHATYGAKASAATRSRLRASFSSAMLRPSRTTIVARPARGDSAAKNAQHHPALTARLVPVSPQRRRRVAASGSASIIRAVPMAISTYSGVQTTGKAIDGGCQAGFSSDRYHCESGVVPMDPTTAAAADAAKVLIRVRMPGDYVGARLSA